MTCASQLPEIIQGGMGIGISGWRLARTVSMHGGLGVVSGTASDALMCRVLQDGDPGGHLRRALEQFPVQDATQRILARYFLHNGRESHAPYRSLSMMKVPLSKEREELIMAATFAEVFLAKEGHNQPVGMNLLTKVQVPTLPSLYGAMLAGVDVVIMGAGIPREIPGVLDRFASNHPASLRLDVADMPAGEQVDLTFDPQQHLNTLRAPMKRPLFLAIVSSTSLATMLHRRSTGRVDGFVVESPTAGGHNAPPRGEMHLSERGEPLYSERDRVDLAEIGKLGPPFWVAGGAGTPEALREARAAGAAGIQGGTLMAFCEESGMDASLRQQAIDAANAGLLDVVTDPRASPTGYPFKIVQMDGRALPVEHRTRRCDLGYLRTPYRLDDGRLSFRCSAEPVSTFVAKGGVKDDAVGRRCLCNALLATTGHGQVRKDGTVERPIITAGDQARELGTFLKGRNSYTAIDVLRYLSADG